MKFRRNKFIIHLLRLLIALSLVSCTAGTCFDETESRSKAGMYKIDTKAVAAPDSLTLFGVGMDTNFIYKKSLNIKKAEFPLNVQDTVSRFVVRINGVDDTMIYKYTSYIHLISKDCGYTYYFTLDSISFTKNNIDSVAVVKNTVTTLDEENIRIYY
jgi:hypothetical protein